MVLQEGISSKKSSKKGFCEFTHISTVILFRLFYRERKQRLKQMRYLDTGDQTKSLGY